jgi:hypothetical protein
LTTAVQQLADIREQWGDLLAAIERPPAQEWPPRELRHTLDAADTDPGPQVGRLPLTLREHPAPVNLDALDAACAIETALFALADRIAAAVQRPMRILITSAADRADARHADRWHFPTNRDIGGRADARPGSRGLGLHWAAVWIEDRLTATEPTELHGVVRGVLLDHAEQTIAAAHRAMQRALGRDGRATTLPAPCPWCHGELTARTTSGDPMAAVVTCGTGPTCTAPAPYDGEARRVWRGADLCGLYGAMSAAEQRATA